MENDFFKVVNNVILMKAEDTKDNQTDDYIIRRKMSLKSILYEIGVPELADCKWAYICGDNGEKDLCFYVDDGWILFEDLLNLINRDDENGNQWSVK